MWNADEMLSGQAMHPAMHIVGMLAGFGAELQTVAVYAP